MDVSHRGYLADMPRTFPSLGGQYGGRAVLLLAASLSLSSADLSTVGAMSGELERSLHIDNVQLGLLVSIPSAIGAVMTVPFGILADRAVRTRLLALSALAWAVIMAACALAPSYLALLGCRLALGASLAAAGPLVASLTGDLFPPADRGRVYGVILGGELVGAGAGLLVSGNVATLWSWRASFALLAVLALVLSLAIHVWFSEPARSYADHQDEDVGKRSDVGAVQAVQAAGVEPRRALVLDSDPTREGWWWAARYVLSVRTNVVLIVSSSLAYFFYAGLQTFGVAFLKGRFGLGEAEASLMLVLIGAGALAGLAVAGLVSDRLVSRHVAARPITAGACFLLAAVMFAPGLLWHALVPAGIALFLALGFIAAAHPPVDAARLDVMPARLWGRAESVRTVVRTAGQAAAPTLFGYVSSLFSGRGQVSTATGAHAGSVRGLALAYLSMLVPLAAAGLVLLLVARRTYPRDVATAAASTRRLEQHGPDGDADATPKRRS